MLSFNPLSSFPLSAIVPSGTSAFKFLMIAGLNNQPVSTSAIMGDEPNSILTTMSNKLSLVEGLNNQAISCTGEMNDDPASELENF